MNQKIKYTVYGLVFWLLMFLAWEWYFSYPRVRWSPAPFPQNKSEKIDSLLIQSLSDFLIPGLAVGIVEDEKLIYLKSFGYQILESKDSMRIDTPLPVASISKIFTALTVAEYINEQELSAQTTLTELLPNSTDLPKELQALTLGQLLAHTSGLEDRGALGQLGSWKKDHSLALLPERMEKGNGKIGQFRYADINYDLLGWLVQTHAKKPFDSVSKNLTLNKAGMNNSFFIPAGDSSSYLGHVRTFPWRRIKTKPLQLSTYPSPSSGLVVTASDLSKFLLHFSRGKMSDFQTELSWLHTSSGHPVGFQSILINEKPYLGHYGGEDGFSALVLFSQDWERGFFLLSNSADQADHRKKIASAILQILDQP